MNANSDDNPGSRSVALVRSAISGLLLVAVGVLLVLIYQSLPLGTAGGQVPQAPSPLTTAAPQAAALANSTMIATLTTPSPTPSPEPSPSATPSPTAVPPTPTPLPPIVVDEPKPGQSVHSPVRIAGSASVFEGTVSYQIVDLKGTVLGKGFTTASEGAPGRGSFSAELEFAQPATQQECQVQVFSISAKDGSPQFMVAIPVIVEAAPPTATATPAPQPSGQTFALRVQVTSVAASARVISGTDAAGKDVEMALDTSAQLVSGSGEPIDLVALQPGNLIEASGRRVVSRPGAMIANRVVWLAAEAMKVSLYYPRSTANDVEFVPVPRLIPKVPAIGKATIEELLRGPTAEEQAQGLRNPFPKSAHLVTLRIENGVAYADFDRGLEEGVGGSLWVMTIRRSIEYTLKQFSTVQQVVISIEGRTEDILQP